MTMLQTFDLKGNKQSFADWISNLSPCETPFVSMIGKEKVDQTQYSWQTDALAQPSNTGVNEGAVVTFAKPAVTKVVTNFTQIFRKAVRVADTTKKISLYGRASELAYQMEKAGMEIKRDVEFTILNSREAPRPGTAQLHGVAAGVQALVAPAAGADTDTGAVVHKVVTYASGAHVKPFTQLQVFDLTYNLYLAGARANKVMVHPSNMWVFSDWVGANALTPHVHRMFDGMESKYNAHVSTFRDPLGQVFDIIPNRYMPKNQLFFFHEGDWTQMVLREPTKTELGKTGSSEKHLIEMEVGLRHRNPFASGILEFNVNAFRHIETVTASPSVVIAGDTAESESTITIRLAEADGTASTQTPVIEAVAINDDGTTAGSVTVTASGAAVEGIATGKVKYNKAARVKVTAKTNDHATNPGPGKEMDVEVGTFDSRD